jgi:thymidine kinase
MCGKKLFLPTMFLEPHRNTSYKKGWIEVVCGSMFSGKTEELIRRLNRAKIANQKVEIFKPSVDTRYDENDVVSHNSNSISSTPVGSSLNILLMTNDADVIGIDEAQFFDDELVYVCEEACRTRRSCSGGWLRYGLLGKTLWPHAQTDGHCRICY